MHMIRRTMRNEICPCLSSAEVVFVAIARSLILIFKSIAQDNSLRFSSETFS